MIRNSRIAIAVGLAIMASAALAAKPAETIAARQADFKQIGRSFKAITDEIRKPAPDMLIIRSNAQTLQSLSGQIGHKFPRGTDSQAGVKTAALPAIWQRQADFQRASGQFSAAARALHGAAASGDLGQIRTAVGGVGGSCRACHEAFRQRD